MPRSDNVHSFGAPSLRQVPSVGVQFWDLLRIEMTNWRWSWRSMIIVDTLGPLFSMLALSVFARDAGAGTLAYVMTGNLVLALMFGNLDKMASHFSYMRFMGSLDYYATLPVHKYVLILAAVCSFLILSLPSLLVTLLAGALILHIPLSPHPLLVLVIPLCGMPLSGIGALLASVAHNPQEAGSLSLLFTLVLAAMGPVIVPPERLPSALVTLGHLSPATYAASALRQALLGPLTAQILLDVLALLLAGTVVFWLVVKLLDWRVSGE